MRRSCHRSRSLQSSQQYQPRRHRQTPNQCPRAAQCCCRPQEDPSGSSAPAQVHLSLKKKDQFERCKSSFRTVFVKERRAEGRNNVIALNAHYLIVIRHPLALERLLLLHELHGDYVTALHDHLLWRHKRQKLALLLAS